MRTRRPTRLLSDRSLTLRALALSIGLHAAAAAAYGGYRLGGSLDSPARLDVAGSAWVSISMSGEPGAAGRRASGDGDARARAPSEGPGEVAAQPGLDIEPAPPAQPSPSMLPLVAAAVPEIEAVVDAVGHTLADTLEASIESIRHPLPTAESTAEPPAEPAVASAVQPPVDPEATAVAAAAGLGEGDAGDGGEVPGGHGLGDAGRSEGAGQGDGAGGGEAGAGVRGLGVGGNNKPPVYPQAARLAGQEGVVVVLALSDSSGAVERVSIEQSSGFPLLDESALAAVRGWTFVPAVENGVAVAGYVRVPIWFHLKR